MFIIDGHEDLAWNMLTFGRNYIRSVEQTRRIEIGSRVEKQGGISLLGWPDYQRGRVAVIFATLFASPMRRCEGNWDTQCYTDDTQAAKLYRAQLESYMRLQDDYPDHFRIIRDCLDLNTVFSEWKDLPPDHYELLARGVASDSQMLAEEAPEHSAKMASGRRVGLVLLMEGAEGVRDPGELEEWWALGLRIIGPAWAGTRFCGGTREPGPLTKEGFALLESMASFGFILDVSHMDEAAVLQALDSYPQAIIASHANVKSCLKGLDNNRHLSDRVIRGLIERQAVIGVMPINKFLVVGWESGDRRALAPLERTIAHIDTICQLAGNAQHVGVGTDFDGGFGLGSVPPEIDTIADLRKLIPMLAEKGYTEADISLIMGQNWARVLQQHLPEHV